LLNSSFADETLGCLAGRGHLSVANLGAGSRVMLRLILGNTKKLKKEEKLAGQATPPSPNP